MERHSSNYAIASSFLPRSWRLLTSCALLLLLIPASLAQNSQEAIVTFTPVTGWDSYILPAKSIRSSDSYYANFVFDAAQWDTLTVVASVVFSNGMSAPVNLEQDGAHFAYVSNGATTFPVASSQHKYNFKISAADGTPSSGSLSIEQITFSKKATVPESNIPTQTSINPVPNATVNPAASLSSNSLTLVPSASAAISSANSNTNQTQATATLPNASDASSTQLASVGPLGEIPSGLLSPPPNTMTRSISDASFTTPSTGDSGPNSSAIAGAVFGIVAGLALCIFAAICYRRRRIRNRVAPSTAFMNYRSTTEQPPAYPFSRTSFFQRSRASLTGGLGGDSKRDYPHPFAPATGLGYGTAASGVSIGAGGRRLMTLDEKSAEGRESAMSAPIVTPSYEDPQRLMVPAQGLVGPSASGVGVGDGVHEIQISRGLSLDGVARTLTPPPSTTSDKFGSTPSLMSQNPYDGLAPPDLTPELPVNPFGTPPASEINVAGRGAWGRG